MDTILQFLDYHLLTPYVYPTSWEEENPWRQMTSLVLMTTLALYMICFGAGGIFYLFAFDKNILRHPLVVNNQIRQEISSCLKGIPLTGTATAFVFFLQIRGFSKVYSEISDTPAGHFGLVLSTVLYLVLTDLGVYLVHRLSHHRFLYERIHKIHHKWKITTPFSAFAVHPLDGIIQTLPYFIYPFVFPVHKWVNVAVMLFIGVWTVSLHVGGNRLPAVLKPLVSGSVHHAYHHAIYNCNYGQYLVIWDKLGGSFKDPASVH